MWGISFKAKCIFIACLLSILIIASSFANSSENFEISVKEFFYYEEPVTISITGPPNTPFSLNILNGNEEIFSRTSFTNSAGSYFLSIPLEKDSFLVIVRSGQTVVSKEFVVGALKEENSEVNDSSSYAQPVPEPSAPTAPLTSSAKTDEPKISKNIYGPSWTETCEGSKCTKTLLSSNINIETSDGYKPFNEVVSFNASEKYLELKWNEKTVSLKPYIIIGGIAQEIPSSMNFQTEIKSDFGFYKWSHRFTNIPLLDSLGLTIKSDLEVNVLDDDTIRIGEIEIDFSDLYNVTCDELGCTDSGIDVKTKQVDENTADVKISGFSDSEIVLDPTVMLQTPDSQNLDDSHVRSESLDSNYGTATNVQVRDRTNRRYRTYIKFNISSLPSGVKIDNALLCLYLYSNG